MLFSTGCMRAPAGESVWRECSRRLRRGPSRMLVAFSIDKLDPKTFKEVDGEG